MEGFCNITYRDYANGTWHTRDAWTQWGLIFEDGTYDAFLSLPSKKERYIYDWGGNDGLEIWEEEDVKLQAREVVLPLILIGRDLPDFMAKYNAFRSLLLANRGYIEFHFLELDRRVKLRYLSSSSVDQIGTVRGTGEKGVRLSVTFMDDNPRIEPMLPASTFNPDMGFDIILD